MESMSYVIAPFRSGSLSLTAPDGNVHNAPVMYVDGGFWDVFQFEFRDGQAPGEWNPVRVEAVVSETFARRCFGSQDEVLQCGRTALVRLGSSVYSGQEPQGLRLGAGRGKRCDGEVQSLVRCGGRVLYFTGCAAGDLYQDFRCVSGNASFDHNGDGADADDLWWLRAWRNGSWSSGCARHTELQAVS